MKRFPLRRMAAATVIVCSLALLPVIAAADEKVKTAPEPVNAAVVNGKAIAYTDFQWELDLYVRRLESQGMQVPEHLQVQVRKEVIDDLVNRELIYQESVEKGITVNPEDVDKELEAIKQRYPDRKQFDAILDNMKMSEEKLKGQIAQRNAITTLLEQEIVSKIQVTDTEVKAFYDDNPNLFERPEEVRARHILIRMEPTADAKVKAEARENLMAIKQKVEAGEDFAALAQAHSQCPSAQNGGDLGFFSRGKMVPEFEKAAFDLKLNTVSDIVETDFGYHLIEVVERRQAGTMGFEEVQPQIASNLRNERIQNDLVKYLDQLRAAATIENFVQ